MRRRRWIVAGALCVVSLLSPTPRSVHADPVYDPELVKAGVLSQLVRFVEWPDGAGGPHPGAIEVAFLGPGRVADALSAMTQSRCRVRVVRRVEDLGRPHVVYVTRGFDGSLAATLHALGSRPVLVVGDGPHAAARGAAFGLRDDGTRVRIEFNRSALSRTGLRVSYHVLRLATEVRP